MEPLQVVRHKKYIKALRAAGVEVIHGRFMEKNIECHRCGKYFLTHEEKRTDVNIAVKLFGDAIDDLYNKALIVSADSNLIPAIKAVHKYFPDKEIGIMFPIGRNSYDLRQEVDFRCKMPEKLLLNSQFPDQVKVGTRIISRPSGWR